MKYCVFGFLLLGLIFTDAETKLLPDKLTLPGLALGLLLSLLVPVHDMASQFLPGILNLPISADLAARLFSLLDSLLGAALGASFIYGAGAIYLRWRGAEGMGFGDVKLMAMVGAFLGMKLTIFTIFAASLAGSMFGLTTVLIVWIKRTHRFTRRLATLQARAPPRLAVRANGLSPLSNALRRFPGQHGFAGAIRWQPVPELVREVLVVRLFANPLVLPAALVLAMAAGAFVFAVWVIRRLRRNIAAEAELDSTATPTLETLPLHLYNTVIQQLKQQKHELQVQTLAEQHRARTTENFSQAVLSNLSSGVLVFGLNGLVKQANPAAKEILGFSSLSGMSAEDIFRGAAVCKPGAFADGMGDTTRSSSAKKLNAVLREGSKCRQLEADYATPAGQKVRIAVTISPVPGVDGSLLGAACLISDRSEFEQIRHQQELHGEISAEMALELRTSLATIAGYAQQLARNRDPEMASQLAADIASEASRLDRHIGGFLSDKCSTAATATRASAAGQQI